MRPGGSRRTSPQNVAAAAAMAGAVDLAAVKARSEAAARAAEAPAPSGGTQIVDVTEATLQSAVVDRSFQVPVLLLLNSARVPGADALVRDLESLAGEYAGQFVLAKVDIDVELRIAQLTQIRAVPALLAVIGGQLLPLLEGGVPSTAELRQVVDAVLSAAAQQGLGAATPAPAAGETDLPADPRFDAAEEALAEGNYPLARQRFQRILDEEPGNALAATALQQIALLERIQTSPPPAGEPVADDVTGHLALADVEFAGAAADDALERLLGLLPRLNGDDRESVRTRLIEYFDLLGPEDPRVAPARRRMAQALF